MRCLVVANRTLVGEHLLEAVRARIARGPCELHLLVPGSHSHGTWTEGEARAAARRRLDDGLAKFRELGATATGEVGDQSPLRAVEDLLRRDAAFDEIILSTLPPGPSRWLAQDLPHRVARISPVPVTHLVAQPDHAEHA